MDTFLPQQRDRCRVQMGLSVDTALCQSLRHIGQHANHKTAHH
jgi:hypothetical protein